MSKYFTLFIFISLYILWYLNVKEGFITSEAIHYSPHLTLNDIQHLKMGQVKMSKMLQVLDGICIKHNIRYFVIGGTLIGVMAYSGWVPWDGDVDVEVAEEDYPKLRRILIQTLKHPMWFQDKYTDPLYKGYNIAKIRDLESCYIEYSNRDKTSHNGLQLDINIYQEKNNRIYFPDNPRVDYLTTQDIYPLKRHRFQDFYVNIMNRPETYLVNNYGPEWIRDLPIPQRYPHEGKISSKKTCRFHPRLYPELY
jgi:hypothetical protein